MLLGIDTSGAVSVAVARGELPGTDESAPAAELEILAVRSDARSRTTTRCCWPSWRRPCRPRA